ncbi:MAG TPA: VWA domain-containing protein [Candidatus Nanoarchaeia archaeon]|nr:VWA domain-containing protein [Candidatus Nanoarchaeia archaeon]
MLLDATISQGLFAFNPDMMYEQLVKNYENAEKMYGESMLRLATGYDPNALKKNIKFPEFQRELKNKMQKMLQEMKDENFLDDQNKITDRGIELASLVLYMEELNDLRAKGIGEKKTRKPMLYGEKMNVREYRKHDRYHDLALKSIIKTSIRRGHKKIENEDLRVFERESKGKIYIIYALDASGSMKGNKINLCKKAGIALAYKAIEENDKAGLIVFGTKIEEQVYPTSDFSQFIMSITRIRAQKQTDIALTIEKAIEMFPKDNVTKHLVLITDAVPTVGEDPSKNTLNLVERATALGISISVIGIEIDKEGIELAKKIVEIGNGRLYIVKGLENLDRIVLQDYYSL